MFLDYAQIREYESFRLGTNDSPTFIGISKGYTNVESLWFIFMVAGQLCGLTRCSGHGKRRRGDGKWIVPLQCRYARQNKKRDHEGNMIVTREACRFRVQALFNGQHGAECASEKNGDDYFDLKLWSFDDKVNRPSHEHDVPPILDPTLRVETISCWLVPVLFDTTKMHVI